VIDFYNYSLDREIYVFVLPYYYFLLFFDFLDLFFCFFFVGLVVGRVVCGRVVGESVGGSVVFVGLHFDQKEGYTTTLGVRG